MDGANAINVKFGVQIDGEYVLMPTTPLSVAPGVAVEYGLMEIRDPSGCVVVLDALVEAHRALFGAAITPLTCSEYMKVRYNVNLTHPWLKVTVSRIAFER